ncbi:hypothetical protein HWC21_gp117 [Vibrio phage VAP7]|uniref:SAP domain-containing protein n=1 Tax=Vibrio phage VAP7 TaxID=2584487 RepID=A0A4Y5TWF8_9CAUD|nr:hypothetical protein HWC21_gp117 [Vibrio phage VAP7]QDB73299.1 hypothetical protein [Vibrio phage VAP7]UFD98016.1 hypothetical protein [Vibrio phage BX-1]
MDMCKELLEHLLAEKPSIEEHDKVVFATNKGWCTEACDGDKEPECVYEAYRLLELLETHGYDKYGKPLNESKPTGNTDGDDSKDGSDIDTKPENDGPVHVPDEDGKSDLVATDSDTTSETGETDHVDEPDKAGTEETDKLGPESGGTDEQQKPTGFDVTDPKTYTQAELEQLPIADLKKLGESIGVKGSTKPVIAKRIMEKTEGMRK